jgi:hypothetical protein
MKKTFRKLAFLFVILSLCFTLLGCQDEGKVKREVIPSLVENFVNETQKAIEKKDGKLARDIWSKVTEYSVQANEYGDEELSEAIKSLAITYVKLIEYCDNGDLNNLTMFNEEFEKALENIKSISNF